MLISVCIPLYEAPVEYLAAALESVLNQQGDFDIEVIVYFQG